jgi:hypothetical protein
MFDSPEETLLTVCMLMYVSIAAATIVIFDGEQEEKDKTEQDKTMMMVQALQAFRRLDKFPSIVLPTFLGEASNRRTLS